MQYFHSIMLNAGVYAPLLGAVVIVALWTYMGARSVRGIAMAAASVSLLSALSLWADYFLELSAGGKGVAVFSDYMGFLPAFGLNGISMPMYALAGIVGFAATYWAVISKMENPRLYFTLLLFMQGGLMGAFAATNVLWMYMFHEFALVPTFIAMTIWGGAGKRIAAIQMAIYLTLGALVSLAGIIALYMQTDAASFEFGAIVQAMAAAPLDASWQGWIFALLLFGLGTLVSLFPFYSWAPRGYAAAPTSFAMLHAGVLKKFGLYVLIQVAVPLLPVGAIEWGWTLAVLALFNVIYIGLVTMAQRDLKLMVSYSSVAHMGLCFLGIASMSVIGAGGAVVLMFGHGLSVALLFLLSNVITNRTEQWDMLQMGGLYKQTPVLAAMFVMAIMASIGLPGFANFWGELSVLVSLWDFSPAICALGATGIIISAIYGLRAVARIFMGEPSEWISKRFGAIADISVKERIPAIILIAALMFVGFCPESVTKGLDADMKDIPAYSESK